MPKYITVKNSNELQKYLMDRCPMLKENPPKSRTIDKRIKELSRYADFEKIEGKQGYKIKNIYDFPKPKVTKYSKEYLPLLEDNLLQFLLTMGNSTIMSKSQLAKIMNMVNINYYPLKYRKKKLSRYTGLKVEIINEFYKTTTELNDRNILQVLKSLKSRGLINFKPCMVKEQIFTENIQEVDNNGEIINKINNYSIYSELTNEEFIEIEKIKNATRNRLGIIGNYMSNSMFAKFQNEVNEEIFNKMKIKKYYNAYLITSDSEQILKFYKEVGFEDRDKVLNEYLTDDIISLAKNKSTDKYIYRNNKDYISTYENLNNILINDNGENIIQKVINIKGLQDNYNIEDIEYIKELNSLDEYGNGDKIIIGKIKID